MAASMTRTLPTSPRELPTVNSAVTLPGPGDRIDRPATCPALPRPPRAGGEQSCPSRRGGAANASPCDGGNPRTRSAAGRASLIAEARQGALSGTALVRAEHRRPGAKKQPLPQRRLARQAIKAWGRTYGKRGQRGAVLIWRDAPLLRARKAGNGWSVGAPLARRASMAERRSPGMGATTQRARQPNANRPPTMIGGCPFAPPYRSAAAGSRRSCWPQSPAPRQAAAAPVDGVCAALARQAEREQGIPPGLVQALALAESGRWHADEGTTRPWPWTVTSGTDSFFLRVQARGPAQGGGAAHRGPHQHRRRLHADQPRLPRSRLRLAGRGARAGEQRRLRGAVPEAAARGDPVVGARDRALSLARIRSAAKPIAKRCIASGNRCAKDAWPNGRRSAWLADRWSRRPRP